MIYGIDTRIKMTKQLITEYGNDWISIGDDISITDLLNSLVTLRNKIMDKGGILDTIKLNVYADYDYTDSSYQYQRYETDEEYEKRIKEETKLQRRKDNAKKLKKEREYKKYLELKKKFKDVESLKDEY